MEKFSQLSYYEREKIYTGLYEGKSQRDIALSIGRDKSTISRELSRNSDHIGYLYPGKAHEMAFGRKNKNKPKLEKNHELAEFVVHRLKKKWSPNAAAGSWNRASPAMTITDETIYQWIYTDPHYYDGDSWIDLRTLLLRKRKNRGMRRKIPKSTIKNRVSIHERPEIIDQNVEVGHYEGDLIFHSGSQSANVLTLIDRKTKHTVLIKNDDKRSKTVIGALMQRIKSSELDIKSITFDNGSEFAEHTWLNGIGIKTYFCDPGSPWQKGGIENLNGVARRFLPFNLEVSKITSQLVQDTEGQLNHMPRQSLGFMTPFEAFQAGIG
jgi:transposase, IS30 family